ncbi:MAG TPA: hypothetical protein VGH44_03920 [Candidatus Saccharimonadia bacterium]|jgi:hypothetical protein
MASNAIVKQQEQLSGNNLIIVLTLITLLAVGVAGLAAKALIGSITLDNKVLKAKNLANTNLQSDVDAAPKLVDAYAALGTQAGVIADALPDTTDFPGLIVVLENMTNDAGLRLKSVAPTTGATAATATGTTTTASGDASQAPPPQPFDFSLSFDGRYDTLLKLLDHLEKSARPMRITGLQITGSGSALSGTVTAETYYQDKAQLPLSTETIK